MRRRLAPAHLFFPPAYKLFFGVRRRRTPRGQIAIGGVAGGEVSGETRLEATSRSTRGRRRSPSAGAEVSCAEEKRYPKKNYARQALFTRVLFRPGARLRADVERHRAAWRGRAPFFFLVSTSRGGSVPTATAEARVRIARKAA